MVIGLDSANRAIQSFRISIVLIVSQFKSVYSSCRVKVLSSAGDTKRSSRSTQSGEPRSLVSFHVGVLSSARLYASRAAVCTACHGVRSHPVPVALVGECSIPVVSG
jgi:hypothetical protein